MNQVFVGCLVLALSAGALAEGPGYYNYHDLHNLAVAINDVAEENDFLLDRAKMMLDQKAGLQNTLNMTQIMVTEFFGQNSAAHEAAITMLSTQVRSFLIALKGIGAMQARGLRLSDRVQAQLDPTWRTIDQLSGVNNAGVLSWDVPMAEATAVLQDTVLKATDILQDEVNEAADALGQIEVKIESVVQLVSTKKCVTDFVNVEMTDGSGSMTLTLDDPNFFQEGMFQGYNVPKVTCGIQGVISKLNLDDPYSHGYEDERQNSAFTVDCKATTDSVIVNVFDQSRGYGNVVMSVYVEAQICSFYNAAGFLPEMV